jgi:hypothetical protein
MLRERKSGWPMRRETEMTGETVPDPALEADLRTIQPLILPGGIGGADERLFLRLSGGASVKAEAGEIALPSGARVTTDTFSNVFPAGKWIDQCALSSLYLDMRGEGTVALRVSTVDETGTRSVLVERDVHLAEGASVQVDIPLEPVSRPVGLLYCAIMAQDAPARLRALDWATHDAPRRMPTILAAMTTFDQTEAALNSAERFEAFVERSPLKGLVKLLVVDNSSTLDPFDLAHASVVQSANLGGSGGFSRGLLEARDRGFTHCIFMDDDAQIDMAMLTRVWAFLAYAQDPGTAVCGGLMQGRADQVIWENGAIFKRVCLPVSRGLDVADFDDVIQAEYDSYLTETPSFYGGWWFFAFPTGDLEHFPFPFFVRGDDISFSLMNRFNFVTLPGVVCQQDVDFFDKESPRALYLDVRNHMVQHLTAPQLLGTRGQLFWIMQFFFFRSFFMFGYDSIHAIALAMRDVVTGPERFRDAEATLARFKEIGGFTEDEKWVDEVPPARNERELPKLVQYALIATLNGHLVPFYGAFARHAVLDAKRRGATQYAIGASRVTLAATGGERSMHLKMNRRKALSAAFAFWKEAARLLVRHKAVSKKWEEGYPRLASEAYWRDKHGM